MYLRNKRILIISTESWDHIKLSKHHYALELANLGNQVFFLNPPTKELATVNFSEKNIHKNLTIVRNRLFFPFRIRKYSKSLFNYLMRFQVKKINRHFGKFDVVWSFSPLYTNLKKIDASLHIFHAVDMLHDTAFSQVVQSANWFFFVTAAIGEKYEHPNKNLIGHGLSSLFLNTSPTITSSSIESIHVAYCGNLEIESIDRSLILNLVNKHPEVTFHMIGPYNSKINKLQFITDLENATNVVLYGKVTPEKIASIYLNIDAFISCYKRNSSFAKKRNGNSNSHKLLEYISTGKVVISTNMSAYNNQRDVLEMLDEDGNEKFEKLFNSVITNLDEFNKKSRMEKRIAFAHQNSYQNRIKEIEALIGNNY